MNTLEKLFPEKPKYSGLWQTIYLEPMIGSGESIAVAVVATGLDGESRTIQAIRAELLECLYGSKAVKMQGMIDWLVSSASAWCKTNGSIENWQPPFDGIKVGKLRSASDDNIEGILRQAVTLTASLSSISLDADREEDDMQPQRYAERWTSSISEEVKLIEPHLFSHFRSKIKIGDSGLFTTFGFLNDGYVSNFGLLVPSRLSNSLNSVKARLLDLETLKKSQLLLKPEKFELVIGVPSFDDPTLTDKSVKRLKETIALINEVASAEDIELFSATSAKVAAEHIVEMAA